MKNNLKRIMLGSAAISGLVAPIVIMASCSTSSSKINYEITTKNFPELTEADIIDDNFKELTTLEKLFNGITDRILRNLIVSKNIITDGGVYTITLTTKSGYEIEGKTAIISEEFTLLTQDFDLDIIPITDPEITSEDISEDEFMQLSTLVKLFDGINSTNINNFVVYMNTIVEGRTYSVTLNANHGFTINGATT
ncbi:MAG: hypothetical protein ACRCXE_01480, partial [Metamycoplasmataceae bacterium]